MSPFDEARYARLLEGLEIAEIRFREVMDGTDTSRIDPEYFNREALETLQLIEGDTNLGGLVQDGYRVVYETTETIDREVGEKKGLPFFLQAADITAPFINAESMLCVAEADWVRYPKGRIQPGELLIEVKGKAEKNRLGSGRFPAEDVGNWNMLQADDEGSSRPIFSCRISHLPLRPDSERSPEKQLAC